MLSALRHRKTDVNSIVIFYASYYHLVKKTWTTVIKNT